MFVVFTEKKISLIVLGNGDSLKNQIHKIRGKDSSEESTTLVLTENHENDTYEITCSPDLDTACKNIREKVKQHPHMCLLVLEDGLSAEEASQKEEQEKNKNKEGQFNAVLLHSFKPLTCTIEDVPNELRKLAEDKNLSQTER